MTDKIKRDARARAAATGESYTRARRTVARQPATAADVPGAGGVPQPVAVMLARHLRAAALHLSTWRNLAEGARALPRDSGPSWEEPTGPAAPIAKADRAVFRALMDMQDWSERTALASGAITALPEHLPGPGGPGPDALAARRALYPQPAGDSGGWCAADGGHLPQPGEEHAGTDDDAPGLARHLLPGPVPDWELSMFAEGRDVRRARDVVPGTPAAPIWDAAGKLNRYVCGWMDRTGDSPADLATALEGLAEVADQLASVTAQVLGEITRRTVAGTLDGVDEPQLQNAHQALGLAHGQRGSDQAASHLRHAFYQARGAITGATAQLPAAEARIPAMLARKMTGKTPAQIRGELGHEMFYQRQRGKTRPTDYTRAEALERILTWMHATGTASYDPAAHAATDPAAGGAR